LATIDDVMDELKEIRKLIEEMRGASGDAVLTTPVGTYFRAPARALQQAGLAEGQAAAALAAADEVLCIPLRGAAGRAGGR